MPAVPARATVANADGATLTLNFKEGEKKIDVVPDTVIYTYAPGSKDELKPGAVVIAAATKQADGTLLAARINVGRGVDAADVIQPARRVGACAEPGAVTSRSAASSGISRIRRSRRLCRPPGVCPRWSSIGRRTSSQRARPSISAPCSASRASRCVRSSSCVGDHVDDADSDCTTAGDRDIARAQHHRAHALEHLRPDDDIGDRAFVLDGHEHHALGRARPLPAGDQAGNAHALAGGDASATPRCARCSARGKIGAQELRRMRAQRQPQEAVVVDHFLAQRHGGQMHVCFSRDVHCVLPPPERGRAGEGVIRFQKRPPPGRLRRPTSPFRGR